MCTVTVVPFVDLPTREHGVRLACNRDELLRRPAALPPEVRRFGRYLAVLPVDPSSGGTWVGVNDAGLAMALLNSNRTGMAGPPRTGPVMSRGLIIPALLHCDSLATATMLAATMPVAAFAPFRLVLLDRHDVAAVCSTGKEVQLVGTPRLTDPVLFTSSGLGDELVEPPRRQLFNDGFQGRSDWLRQQDAFHRHRWPDRTHLSVCMSRSDARTVSHTIVEIGPTKATLTYYPDAPDQPAQPVSISLGLTEAGGP